MGMSFTFSLRHLHFTLDFQWESWSETIKWISLEIISSFNVFFIVVKLTEDDNFN